MGCSDTYGKIEIWRKIITLEKIKYSQFAYFLNIKWIISQANNKANILLVSCMSEEAINI